MINAKGLCKRFGEFTALDHIDLQIEKGSLCGIVGANGAGKSTLLRMLSGIYKADEGTLSMEDESIWENTKLKSKVAFVADELYFIEGANLKRMALLYRSLYDRFDAGRYSQLVEAFKLSETRPIEEFSKGMRRQAAMILALSLHPEYLFLDETFDGLDPIIRQFVKEFLKKDVLEQKTTVVMTSHSLHELEGLCDHLILLHQGKVVLEDDIHRIQARLCKIQVAFSKKYDQAKLNQLGLDIVHLERCGSTIHCIVRGDQETVKAQFSTLHPLLLDILPMKLEEAFAYEMQSLGYDFMDLQKEEIYEEA